MQPNGTNGTTTTTSTLSPIELEMLALRAENERLKAEKGKRVDRPMTFKVGPKGGVSVYGLQRFPVTLRPAQWRRVFDAQAKILAFATNNEALCDKLAEEANKRGEKDGE